MQHCSLLAFLGVASKISNADSVVKPGRVPGAKCSCSVTQTVVKIINICSLGRFNTRSMNDSEYSLKKKKVSVGS